MEGNFLSRYNSKIAEWRELIDKEPEKKKKYESDMAEYIMKCMPYMNQYTDESEEIFNTDNVFNVKETVGLKRRDIFRDYLIDVEKQNISKPQERIIEQCERCPESNIIHFHDTSELVCDSCGAIIVTSISVGLTYMEEQQYEKK